MSNPPVNWIRLIMLSYVQLWATRELATDFNPRFSNRGESSISGLSLQVQDTSLVNHQLQRSNLPRVISMLILPVKSGMGAEGLLKVTWICVTRSYP